MASVIDKAYIGDGVYVEIEDGMLKLTTERENGIETIYLEPAVFQALRDYYEAAVAAFARVRDDDREP